MPIDLLDYDTISGLLTQAVCEVYAWLYVRGVIKVDSR